ncbi:hypothetical protein D1122_15130 [Cereibacter sphaeroides]|nr:hypothetical protein D1122_15130 [Cereibacter sphaeroides]
MVAQPRRGAGGGCRHLEGGGQDAALALASLALAGLALARLAAAAGLAPAARLAGRTCATAAARRSGTVALS